MNQQSVSAIGSDKFHKPLSIMLVALFWSSTNPAAVSINPQTGMMKVIGPGMATICAQYESAQSCVNMVVYR